MPDFTPTIILDAKWKRFYLFGRIFLILLFLATIIFLTLNIVFPNTKFYFNFRNYSSSKNTISAPRYENEMPAKNGVTNEKEPIIFNATAFGSFSKVSIALKPAPNSDQNFSGIISVLHSYRAFLYAEDAPIGWRDGSLLRANKEYYLVSEKKLRKFSSFEDISPSGFSLEQFHPVSETIIQQFPAGENIDAKKIKEKLPEGLIIKIEKNYYQLSGEELVPFVSQRAYLSRFRPEDALEKTAEIFQKYKISKKRIGFLDGTVLSYGESVYVAEGNNLRPIDSPETFLAKGYIWEDVIPLTGEEFGIYARGQLYTYKQPHPNGTVFEDKNNGRFFLIDNGKRKEILPEVLYQFKFIRPIPTETAIWGECELKNNRCAIEWNGEEKDSSAEYQFTYYPSAPETIGEIKIKFIRDINSKNWLNFLKETKQKFLNKYGK